MGHGALADVAVCAVPSEMTEDDLKITATLQGRRDGHRGRAVPLVHRPAARTSRCRATSSSAPSSRAVRSAACSKRTLRDEGVTATTWDAEAAGVTYEKR